MSLKTKLVGSDEVLVVLVGDPDTASQLSSALGISGDKNLSGKYASLTQNLPLLLAADGNYDYQKAAPGADGIPSVNTEGTKLTYSVAGTGFTPAATATDFLLIKGSATKTVRVLRVGLSGIATAAASIAIAAIKRSTAYSGGTASQPTIAPHDANDAGATAVVDLFSANPTVGTSIGNVRAKTLNLGAAGAAGEIVWDFTTRNGKGIVLRGVAQALALNWGGAAVPAGTVLSWEIEFTEET